MKKKPYADPAFAAEMAALAASRKAAEDERMRRPPTVNTVDKSPLLPSPLHRHGDDCLVRAGTAPAAGMHTAVAFVPVDDSWVRCSVTGAAYHRHGDRLVAHLVGDTRFPEEATHA